MKDQFDVFYRSRPRMLFNRSLMHSGSAQKLAELARSKGYEVQFEYGSFPCDIKMNEGLDCYSRMANHSIRSAAAYIQGHPGID